MPSGCLGIYKTNRFMLHTENVQKANTNIFDEFLIFIEDSQYLNLEIYFNK